jgi:hypothetical protein
LEYFQRGPGDWFPVFANQYRGAGDAMGSDLPNVTNNQYVPVFVFFMFGYQFPNRAPAGDYCG